MTKKLVKTMLVCLCLTYTFNAANALGSQSTEIIASVAPSKEAKKESVIETKTETKTETKAEVKAKAKSKAEAKTEAKNETKAEAEVKNEVKASEQAAETKKITSEEVKKPVAGSVSVEQNTPVVSATPAPVAKPANVTHVAKGPTSDIKKMIIDVALSLGVDPYVALSIAKMESGFDQNKRNPSGAVGLFQLMPSTARVLGVNPHVAKDNIKGGLLYYRQLYKRYGSMELALAAYNAGPGNVAKYNGVPPFRETQAFITKIKREYDILKSDPLLRPSGTL